MTRYAASSKTVALCAMLVTVLGCGACRATSSQAPAQTPPLKDNANVAQAANAGSSMKLDALMARVVKWQDRKFKAPIKLVAEASKTLTSSPSRWSAAVERDAALLGTMLWGDKEAIKQPILGRQRLARFEPKLGQILYASQHDDERALEAAIVAELAVALRWQHFGSSDAPCAGVDQCLAGWISDQAHVQFVLAMDEAEQRSPNAITAQQLAERPELVRQLPAYGQALASLERRETLSAFLEVMPAREGLGLATALYRAQGWNALELLASQSPGSTTLIAQPSRWMGGEDVGRWSWPAQTKAQLKAQGFELEHQGHVGAALLGAWIAADERSRIDALQLMGLMREDGVQVWRRGDDARLLVWVMHWQSPTIAQQAQLVLERALRHHSPSLKASSPQIITQGLSSIFVLSPQGQSLSSISELGQARVVFPPREGAIPLKYEPALMDQLFAAPAKTSYTQGQWVDPTLGLEMTLGSLAKQGWDVQINHRPGVRWYARTDSSVAQLHVELSEVFGPEFSAQAYQDKLKASLSTSAAGVSEVTLKAFEHPLGPGYEITVDAGQRRWMVWHIAHEQLRLTLSVEAEQRRFAQDSQQVVALLPTLKSSHDHADSDDVGIINFKIED